MPPGFDLLDAMLVAVPVLLTMLGLIRGAPVELASCCGCIAGIVATWAVSCLGPVQALGQPAAPLVALGAGVVVWQLARGLSRRFGFDTRWVDLGSIFDSVVGGLMGALRGLAFASVGCLAYAMVAVPLGFANPVHTVAYPVFLALGSQVTSAVLARVQPAATLLANATTADTAASVPLPRTAPWTSTAPALAAPGVAPSPAAIPVTTAYVAPSGATLAAVVHTVTPPAAAISPIPMPVSHPDIPMPVSHPDIPMPVSHPDIPMPVSHPDIPVRGIPVALIETHHNIMRPFGSAGRPHHR